MCVLVTFYEWGHFVMFAIESIHITIMHSWTYLWWDVLLFSPLRYLCSLILQLYMKVFCFSLLHYLTYEIIRIIASDMVVLERMI